MNEDNNDIVDKAIDSHNKLVNEFEDESDRATVIIGAAKLDILLDKLLKARLQPTPRNRDRLFDGEAPLSSFSSKINMCYRIGLIKKDFADSLHLLRKIRNTFAHEVHGCTLDERPHKDRVQEFIKLFSDLSVVQALRHKKPGKPVTPDIQFRYILGLMVLLLEIAIAETPSIETNRAISLDAITWKKSEEDA